MNTCTEYNNTPIVFSLKTIEYAFLSNFYPSNITIKGKNYYHVEGYYQAAKHRSTNKDLAEYIRMFKDPGTCKEIARSVDMPKEVLEDWEDGYKLKAMKIALIAKFQQHKELKTKLLETNERELIEYAPWDEYWGSGKYGSGKNMLGKLLEEIRGTIDNLPDEE